MDLKRLEGKVAVITGAGRGIGAAIARRLAAEGAAVVLNSLSESAAQVTEEITASGGKAIFIQGDVSKNDDVSKIIDSASANFGRLDILVNNAGITRDNLLMRMSEEDWDTVMDTNLKSIYLCTKAVIRPMLKNKSGGRIINLSSVIGLSGNAGQANYAASFMATRTGTVLSCKSS